MGVAFVLGIERRVIKKMNSNLPYHLDLVVNVGRTSFLAGSGFFSGRERLRRWKTRLRAGSFDAPALSTLQLLDHPRLHNQPPYY
jgi:hypothetical protein